MYCNHELIQQGTKYTSNMWKKPWDPKEVVICHSKCFTGTPSSHQGKQSPAKNRMKGDMLLIDYKATYLDKLFIVFKTTFSFITYGEKSLAGLIALPALSPKLL